MKTETKLPSNVCRSGLMRKYIDSRTEGTLPRSHFTIRQSGGLGPVSVSPIVGSPLLKKYSSTYPIEFVAKFRNASPPKKIILKFWYLKIGSLQMQLVKLGCSRMGYYEALNPTCNQCPHRRCRQKRSSCDQRHSWKLEESRILSHPQMLDNTRRLSFWSLKGEGSLPDL